MALSKGENINLSLNLLYPSFFLALFATLFFPFLNLSTFAPFLAMLYPRASFIKSTWIAFLCGTILDLLTAYSHLGIYGLNFVLTTAILYKQKKHFFEEKSIALSLFTFLIAATSTLLQLLLLNIFEQGVGVSWQIVLVDVLLLSILDGLYAFLWFTSPLRLYTHMRKVGWKRFFREFIKE